MLIATKFECAFTKKKIGDVDVDVDVGLHLWM
jgi:hypothetical protein